MNLLGATANAPLEARFAAKARLVYEFDVSGTRDLVSMYPAMARHWRNAGVQVACQFQYDARALAHLNWDWPQHYLNLWHVPGKTASYLIGGEVFRRLPRGANSPTPEDDQVFAPAAVSFHRNAALLAAEDCYMQARPTDWRPLPLPEQPRRVLSVGSCPYFEWDGTGAVDLRIEGETATLRIYPDVDRVREGLRGTVEKPLTRLVACKRGTIDLCSISDDANELYRRMVAADLVLIAAPTFCWGFPAQIKGLLDRMFCLMDMAGEQSAAPWRAGKPMGLLLTGGGEETDNADLVIRGFQQLVHWIKGRMAGHLFVGGCTEPEAIGDDVERRATEFAVTLTGKIAG